MEWHGMRRLAEGRQTGIAGKTVFRYPDTDLREDNA